MAPTIYKSHITDLDLGPQQSIYTFLFSKEHLYDQNSPAVIDAVSGAKLTRAELQDLCLRFGHGVLQKGAKRGDVAMIFSPNSIAYPTVLIGLFAAGLRATLANASYTPNELAHQLKDSGAGLIFVHPALFPIVIKTLELLKVSEAEARKRVVVLSLIDTDRAAEKESKIGGEWTRLEEFYNLGRLKSEEQFVGSQVHETTLLCYSSGTTGLSKGVETTHENLTTVLQTIVPIYPSMNAKEDVFLAFLPFFHILVSMCLLLHLNLGVPIVVLPRFDPVLFCQTIERYKVTLVALVPPVLVALTIHPAVDQYDLTSLKALSSGAAPLGGGLVQKVLNKLASRGNKHVYISQGYGLTETSPGSHYLPLPVAHQRAGSIGVLVPNLEARLVDEDENDVKPGPDARGELWLRGKIIMKGYLNNHKATKDSITPDGWFKTGDIATRDEEGYFAIVDRKKELIKYKGFQVPPADLEAILLTHPEIVDVGVIGVHSAKQATELPRAYIVSTKNAALLKDAKARAAFEKQVQEWIKSKVAHHKYLRGGVFVIPAVPKSATGKILRRELRDLAEKEAKENPKARL